jgi:acetyltransferase-like isoleucine patch superfamily enzyme
MKLFKKRKEAASRFHSTTKIQSSSRISRDTEVGKYCYVGDRCDVTRTTIQNYVSIANDVSIGAGEHILDEISTSSLFYDAPYNLLTQGDNVVCSDAWIAVNAVVRRGVTVGFGAVVGANSFVNADVPNFAIVAGSPARLIKYRFPPGIQALILKSEWWVLDFEDAKKAIHEIKKTKVYQDFIAMDR